MIGDRLKIFLYRWFFTNLAGLSLGDWLVLLSENKFRVSPRFLPRAAFITLCSMGNSLQRPIENFLYRSKLRSTIVPAPIFILGHWRSGTTHLHKLISMDERFISPSMVEVLFPHSILTGGPMGMFMNWFLPSHRLVDQVKLGVNEPFEDEFALALMTRMSPYYGWTFPRREDEYDAQLTLDEKADAKRWKQAFQLLASKLALKHGRPAIFKSPPHLGRVRRLLEAFPDARFIHIHRDPVEVFASTCRLIERGIDGLKLQVVPWDRTADHVLSRYRLMYERFIKDQSLIPQGHFVDVSYADLVNEPMKTLERIYAILSLGEFETQRAKFETHLEQEKSYTRNTHAELSPATRRRIKEAWGELASRWGYKIDA